MMRRWMMVLVVAMLLGGAAIAQEASQAPAAQDEAAPAPDPATVLIKVGEEEITQGELDKLLEQVPDFQRSSVMDRALSYMANRALQREYVRENNLTVDEAEYQKAADDLRARYEEALADIKAQYETRLREMRPQMALQAYLNAATADELVAKYIADHPSFFDGTKLTVSHILIKVSMHDSTADQRAARDRLQGIVDRINNRELTFADAAKEFSGCPSSAEGGDLGEIEFGGPMDPYFTVQAFSTAEGHMSKVFRTTFGWHVVLVTKAERGDGTPKPWTQRGGRETSPEDLARRALQAQMENKIHMAVLDTIPVVNNVPEPPKAPAPPAPRLPAPPAPAPAP